MTNMMCYSHCSEVTARSHRSIHREPSTPLLPISSPQSKHETLYYHPSQPSPVHETLTWPSLIVVAVVTTLAFLVDASDYGCLRALRRITCDGFRVPRFISQIVPTLLGLTALFLILQRSDNAPTDYGVPSHRCRPAGPTTWLIPRSRSLAGPPWFNDVGAIVVYTTNIC